MNRVKLVRVPSVQAVKASPASRVSMISSEVVPVREAPVKAILSVTFLKNLKSSSDKEALMDNKEALVEASNKLKDKTLS